jgi:hypothetical protein
MTTVAPTPSVSLLVRALWTRHRWHLVFGVVLAEAATVLGLAGLRAVRADSPASTFVAITPTRVLDTRIAAGLPAALTSAQPQTLDVTGAIPVVLPGDITSTGTPVPDGATAIVANVTIVGPTTPGFVSVRPGTATGDPTTSSLNAATGGVVLPNSVTVELPTTGAAAGTVQLWFQGTAPTASTHLLVDIVGYYQAGGSGAADLAALQAQVTALQAQTTALEGQVTALTTTLSGVTRTGSTLQFSGMNLQIIDGTGDTHGAPNGLGNLVMGYNLDNNTDFEVDLRTGSHNIVIGDNHAYTSTGGYVGGDDNLISAAGATVTTGTANTASGTNSAVVTGFNNSATVSTSAVVAGASNTTVTGFRSVVVGGFDNDATGSNAVVVSGNTNTANGANSAILGGQLNTFAAPGGVDDTIVGGDAITCDLVGNRTTCGEGSIIAVDIP